jgi:hypothetical protein
MAGETFELKFNNNSENYRVTIDEPINFATVDFQLSQKDKGYGRDVSFNGGETQFEFVKYRNHYLDKLLDYNKTYGFESIVELIITCGTVTTIIGELDFATAITDDLEYFKCKVIQQSSKQIVKRRKAVKVDLLSDKDIDGNYIAPLVPENTLLISKPIHQVSKWVQTEDLNYSSSNLGRYANPARSLIDYDIEDTYIPTESSSVIQTDYELIKATTKLKDLKINVNNLNFSVDGGEQKTVRIRVKYGLTYSSATNIFLYNNGVSSGTISFNSSFETVIPLLEIGESIWIYIETTQTLAYTLNYKISGMSIDITAESYTYNSIAPSFRLIDVMRQVVKSISLLDIYAPRFDVAGEFYDNRLFNGNSLRVLSDKPFYVSLEDLEKSLIELNVDWEIDANGDIFFGIEDDFYTNNEVKEFTNTQFSSFNKSFNPRFTINEFHYGYKNFQSLKENEEPNSADVIHGESKWVLQNKSVENKKEISVEWTRDAFLIETNRRKSLEITSDTSSQNDETLFALDSLNTPSDVTYSEKSTFLHTYNATDAILSIINDKSINFTALGIVIGSSFEITAGYNIGLYEVLSSSKASLELNLITGSTPTSNTTPVLTSYTYILSQSTIPYTNYTNNGFTNISNLMSSDKFFNLRYSVRRNIELYWKKYISTCNLYNRIKPVNNTWYKNNKIFSSTYNSLTLIESDPITTGFYAPTLSPFLYNDVIFANVEFSDFILLQNNIRTTRGYIKTYDNNGLPILLYPVNMKYENLSKELTIKGEEKFTSTFVPTIETVAITDISSKEASSGGNILSNGYLSITAKGIVWGTSTNPTTALSTKTSQGTGDASFTSKLTLLTPNTLYYVRAYAVNANGTSYGNEISFTSSVGDYSPSDYTSTDYSVTI